MPKGQDPSPSGLPASSRPRAERRSWFLGLWEALSRFGVGETAIRWGTHTLVLAIVLLAAWGMHAFYEYGQQPLGLERGAFAVPPEIPAPVQLPADLPSFGMQPVASGGISRRTRLHTDVPSRPREEVIQYTVKSGDTLFGISAKFGLQPETVMWSNQYVLGDNPHSLRPDQVLNILPVDGAYHRWSAGDGLNGVAQFFSVSPEAIINSPANHLDPATLGDWANPNIEPGAWLVVPGGRRAFVSWSAPAIPLDNPGVAQVLGPGACEKVTAGVVGTGMFIWPADNHLVTGFDYDPETNHPAIDIDGVEGGAVYAADSGVVVYAGWNNWGYGNVIVINHANGWQTLYAHLSTLYVACGQGAFQGNTVGAIGSTGNSTGPHLHFEMMYNGVRVNPHDYVR